MTFTAQDVRIPSIFKELPALRDLLVTQTSTVQDETVEKCLPFLRGTDGSLRDNVNVHGLAHLLRDRHIEYLYDSLEDYPETFVSLDASRPWMSYWALAALALLGEDVSKYRERVISTLTPMQNEKGGFGGGHGQMSHLASTFPAVLCLALVGGHDAYKLVDRKAMWVWLGRLKQPDGGFQLVIGGEEDVRGAYCAMVIISLLNLPLDLPPEAEARQHGLRTFVSGLPEYLSRCESLFFGGQSSILTKVTSGQTFEGGLSGKPSAAEAHGAYAFCVLACLCILGKPEDMIMKYMDVPLLLSWLSARQYAPEGGYSGRTNKLVDGCYSHWVGDCWPLIQSALRGTPRETDSVPPPDTCLYSREGLARYILNCCQNKLGGLRDKPGKTKAMNRQPDSYHTCYTLTGLSGLQHHHYHNGADSSVTGMFASAFSWRSISIKVSSTAGPDQDIFDDVDRLASFHPLFTIPHKSADAIHRWCEDRPI
ncbi:CaaX farnesyltransferase beta subunit Ram1 [Talaromyces proteolyticus]|uniref:Protein farnesyltransferase subunit beta n=1 Tax=Talaromyces proteolyticus TaxID=1131652 RepID=A0AAD4KVD0_9EURO|nr:CaaX farnesyltransferase beta subunit Ram1 [Talaromyces proteolyticus]KAH8697720.1 CaaX farnesyltransferase beta subunit Ram1 [Talaromyces proteolyticus]